MILPLRLDEATFAVGGRTLVGPVSLAVEAGGCTIVLGANGAGKSVLLRLMHGLLAPSSGTIRWSARDARRHQAMVFQRPVMLRRSALRNVLYALDVAGVIDGRARARAALERVGLAALADRPARVMSVGEQQRLALARVWALRPQVLFLDEPTASLDPSATREVESVVRAFVDAGTTVVMATHDLGQARRLGDRVIYLHRGRVVEHASVATFFDSPATAQAAAFVEGELPWD